MSRTQPGKTIDTMDYQELFLELAAAWQALRERYDDGATIVDANGFAMNAFDCYMAEIFNIVSLMTGQNPANKRAA